MFGEFFSGVALLGQGLRMWLTAPKLMLTGAVPALIVASIYLVGIVVLVMHLGAIADWATPFADDWQEPYRSVIRIAATLALLGISLLIVVFTFTAVTLVVGDPFYERIWRTVEARLGDAWAEEDIGFWRSVARSSGDGARILLLTASIGVVLFVCGFVPLLGQTVVPVFGVLVAGWFLALELTGFAFGARGMSLRVRRKTLANRRARTLGFGVATYLLFLVPFGAVVAMPAAVAGATLLARGALGEPRVRRGEALPSG